MFSLRRAIYKANSLTKFCANRSFSNQVSLFGPVASMLDQPAKSVVSGLHDSYEVLGKYEQQHDEYNVAANAEYDQMIENRLNAIISKGSVSDWELAENNDFLRKTFTFATPFHAHHFVNEVSKFCSTSDHHPEWKKISATEIEVYLTSHFSGNKVSLKDYELAEFMNKTEKDSKGHNPYSWFNPEKKIELALVAIALVLYARGFSPKWSEVPVKTREVDHPDLAINCDQSVDENMERYSLDRIKRDMEQ